MCHDGQKRDAAAALWSPHHHHWCHGQAFLSMAFTFLGHCLWDRFELSLSVDSIFSNHKSNLLQKEQEDIGQ